MSIANTSCVEAVALARRVLRHMGVRTPEEIDIELIAFDYGIVSIAKRLPGHAGNLVRLGHSGHALSAIDEDAFGMPQGRFTLAHELGHHLIEPARSLTIACFEEERNPDYFRAERRADVFAVELLMPEAFFGSLCRGAASTIAFLRQLAQRFQTSLIATGLRFVDFASEPCAVILSRGGRVLRHAETPTFPLRIVKDFEIGHAAFAYGEEILALHEASDRPERVRADHWSRSAKAKRMDVREHSVRLGRSGLVLTLLTLE
jgi:Zn-dependent peptidase ImmA (M78 family)